MSKQSRFHFLYHLGASLAWKAIGLGVILLLSFLTLSPSPVTLAQGPQPTSTPQPKTNQPNRGADIFNVYLPLTFSNYSGYSGIYGRVTQGGSAVNGLTLEMRFYNGSAWSSYGTTTTNADGRYAFVGAPTLGSGQKYYVRYVNPGGTYNSRLWYWYTRQLTSYTSGASVAIGDFDVADIVMVSPPSYSVVTLPYTFQWTRRPATPSDSYQWAVFDPADGNPAAATGLLGYVNGVTVLGLPSGFSTYTPYGWDVVANSPDGGYGETYYYRPVAFTNTGSASAPMLPSSAKPLHEEPPPRPR